MSSEVGTKTSMLSSLRKLLGGDDAEIQDPETGAGNDEATLVLTEGSVEALGDGVPVSPQCAIMIDTEDGDALVLGPTLQTQVPDDTAAPETGSADATTDGDENNDARNALFDLGLEEVGPSSVEFNDNLEVDRPAGESAGGDQQGFDPAVWGPVLSDVSEEIDAEDADAPATRPEEAAEDLAAQMDDDKSEETPVSDQSEDDEVSEAASEAEGDAQDKKSDQQSTEAPDEAGADSPEDFQELLEDTVRRIVREELTGDLGQRLSQNIQKMVRDQVAQAVTSRD